MYVFVFALVGAWFYREPDDIEMREQRTRFSILFPCYKNEEIALQSLAQALKQEYKDGLFEVVLIADGFSDEALEKAAALGVKVIAVSFENSTKAKALNVALSASLYGDFVVILDVDNEMIPQALNEFDKMVQQGYNYLQAHRTAKNQQSTYAYLDALSEEINNTIFRRGQTALGLTSAIIGSGMVFPKKHFTEMMASADAVGGFDKELEMAMVEQKIRVIYLNSVLVFDEKVDGKSTLETQRRRWLSAQVVYLKQYFWTGIKKLSDGDINYFMKMIQLALLPRILLIGVTGLGFVWGAGWLLLVSIYSVQAWLLCGCFVGTFLGLLLAIPLRFYNLRTLKTILSLPGVMLSFFLLLFKLKGANKTFIHTPHQIQSNENRH